MHFLMSFTFQHSQICDLGLWGRKQYSVSNCTAWVNWLILRLGPHMFEQLGYPCRSSWRTDENLMQREWHARTSKEQVQIGREAASEFHKVMEQKWEGLGPTLLFEKEYAAELEKRTAEGRLDSEYETGGSVAFMVHTFALLEPPTALERVIQRAIAMS
ncbi:MAG: hypothetical protein M1830_006139 [Pleopsidium flavum]|nr:MAG: hypothetical protein M1830_006139 [Pleopsidium flavum]